MKSKPRDIEPIPASFASLEEAGEFWDSHDTTDYPEDFETIEVETDLRLRHLDVILDPVLTQKIRNAAEHNGQSVETFTARLLKEGLKQAS